MVSTCLRPFPLPVVGQFEELKLAPGQCQNTQTAVMELTAACDILYSQLLVNTVLFYVIGCKVQCYVMILPLAGNAKSKTSVL